MTIDKIAKYLYNTSMQTEQSVIYCDCAYTDTIDTQAKETVLRGLVQNKIPYKAVPDLCKLSADKDPRLREWTHQKNVHVIACFKRTVSCLFNYANAPVENNMITVYNMRTDTASAIIAQIKEHIDPAPDFTQPKLQKNSEWIPWFPVIDYDLCQSCKLCLNFCLFGVFAKTEQGRVFVKEPANCKTNCPACARVCPHSAIIFPKAKESPINGNTIDKTNAKTQEQPACINDLLNNNIYDMLRKRSNDHKRFSTEPKEKISIIKTLHDNLNIPLDVLQSLSSSDLSRIKTKTQNKIKGNISND